MAMGRGVNLMIPTEWEDQPKGGKAQTIIDIGEPRYHPNKVR
jgi:hypothetical protein